jgi:hypothetical protein
MSYYRILKKTSASPAMLIKGSGHDKDGKLIPIVMKCWFNHNTSDTLALNYESQVYSSRINPLIEQFGDNACLLPSLDIISISIEHMTKILSDKQNEKKHLYKCFTVFYYYNQNIIDYEDKDYINKVYNHLIMNNNTQKVVEKLNIIILPEKNFMGFDEAMENTSLNMFIKYFQKVVSTIKILYKNKIIHNDLHPNNIMVDKHNKIFLFDWDRSYVKGTPNPSLNKTQCKKLCNYSQCNIYNKHDYAIDFYKIISYFSFRKDFYSIMEILAQDKYIKNKSAKVRNASKKIINDFIFKTRSKNGVFFMEKNENQQLCTYLQYPSQNMSSMNELLGGITTIQQNITDYVSTHDSTEEEEEEEQEEKNIEKEKTSDESGTRGYSAKSMDNESEFGSEYRTPDESGTRGYSAKSPLYFPSQGYASLGFHANPTILHNQFPNENNFKFIPLSRHMEQNNIRKFGPGRILKLHK